MENLGALIPLVIIIGFFWLVVIRPAKRRQREHAEVQASAGVGTHVMTASGVFGEIVGESGERLQLQVAPGVVIEVHRQSIGRVLTDDEDTEVEDAASDDVDPAATHPDDRV